MIGAGIFALLGEAGAVAGCRGLDLVPLASSSPSLLAYVCVKLGVRYPSSGGLITFLTRASGRGDSSDRVVARLHGGDGDRLLDGLRLVRQLCDVALRRYRRSRRWDNLFTTAVLLTMVAINMVGASIVASRAVADRRPRARLLRLLRRRHPPRYQPRLPRLRPAIPPPRRSSPASRSRSSPTSASTSSPSRPAICEFPPTISPGRCPGPRHHGASPTS